MPSELFRGLAAAISRRKDQERIQEEAKRKEIEEAAEAEKRKQAAQDELKLKAQRELEELERQIPPHMLKAESLILAGIEDIRKHYDPVKTAYSSEVQVRSYKIPKKGETGKIISLIWGKFEPVPEEKNFLEHYRYKPFFRWLIDCPEQIIAVDTYSIWFELTSETVQVSPGKFISVPTDKFVEDPTIIGEGLEEALAMPSRGVHQVFRKGWEYWQERQGSDAYSSSDYSDRGGFGW